jgi:glycosyltransferase involved in cell wall biosynthesis
MSRIGIDIRNIGKKRTGDEVVFFNLVKNLAEIDGANEYLLFTDIEESETLEKISRALGIDNKDNFKIISLGSRNRFGWNFWSLAAILRKNPVDIYLTQYIVPFFIPRYVKVITIIHDISFNFFPQFIRKSDLLFLKTLLPISLRRADKIVGVSQFTANEVVKYYGIKPEKVTWIHNAVSEDYLRQDVSEERVIEVRRRYKLPMNYILYMGTLQPRKNLAALVEAYDVIKNRIGDTKLVLAGGKGHNYDKRIDELIDKYNFMHEVLMPGYIAEEDKAAVMKGATVFCLPSFYEGFGIPIIEAMSVGTPVVVSDIPAQKEIASDAALFFSPENSVELAERLNSLINDSEKRKEMAERGKGNLERFSWNDSAQKMLGVFEQIRVS